MSSVHLLNIIILTNYKIFLLSMHIIFANIYYINNKFKNKTHILVHIEHISQLKFF